MPIDGGYTVKAAGCRFYSGLEIAAVDRLAPVDRAYARQVLMLMLSEMKWVEPSPKAVITPPGWRLREET